MQSLVAGITRGNRSELGKYTAALKICLQQKSSENLSMLKLLARVESSKLSKILEQVLSNFVTSLEPEFDQAARPWT
jgi:hypothetical protein